MNSQLPKDVIILQELSRDESGLATFIGIINKEVHKVILRHDPLPYGTVITVAKKTERAGTVHLDKSLYVNKDYSYTSWSPVFADDNINMIRCEAKTTGCFTLNDEDYDYPSAFNNDLGILCGTSECRIDGIGTVTCHVTAELVDDTWRLVIKEILEFSRINNQKILNNNNEMEHIGIVTRLEMDEKRDLKLVSCRDFSSDVRIFKKNHRICEHQQDSSKRQDYVDKKGSDLLGTCIKFRVLECSSTTSSNLNRMGVHVDRASIQPSGLNISVHVHGNFAEIRTKCEWSGDFSHNGHPLLWSYDLEYILDDQDLFKNKSEDEIYTVNAVRYHRKDVFAKWRLTKKNAIMKSEPKRARTLSINLGNLRMELNPMTPPVTPNSFSSRSSQSAFFPDSDDSSEHEPLFRRRAFTMPNSLLLRQLNASKTTPREAQNEIEETESQWAVLEAQVNKIVDE